MGSFSKAAEASYVTPSAVIKQINILEDDLGVRLFDRSHRGITLTEAGKSILEDSKEIIRKSNEAINRARATMMDDCGIIRIGTSPMTPAEVLMELWPKLEKIMPCFRFQLIPFDNSEENARMILRNLGENIDVVAGIFDEQMLEYRECNGIELSRDKLGITFSINHPLAMKENITVEDLYGYELMILQPGSMKNMDELRAYISDYHPQIKIVDFPLYSMSVFNECENSRKILVSIDRWKNVHPLLKTVDVDWDFEIPYGLLYSKNPDERARFFIDTIKQII